MARGLLNQGAGIEIRDPFDRTSLLRAMEKVQDEMVEFLKSKSAKDHICLYASVIQLTQRF